MPSLILKSERNFQSDFIASMISQLGITDVSPGSVLDVISQAFAQQQFSVMFQISQLSRIIDVDAMSSAELDLKAFEFGFIRGSAVNSTGIISILRPVGFVKVVTNFSVASGFPISGNTTIDVNDASNALFSTSGTLVLGRGTNNEEEVSYSVAPVNNTTFWSITIDSPLVNNHVVSETVILKQGLDESISSGTSVRVLATSITPEISFSIDNDVVLLSGEDKLDGVTVTAAVAGEEGNIPSKAITGTSAFVSPPFVNVRAENSSKFSTGKDLESDSSLRNRIKGAGDTLTKGVKNAVLNSIVGIVDSSSSKRVVSASVVLPVSATGDVKVYIDDGTGFEPQFTSKGFESVRKKATGGEQRLQLDNFPLQKASVENLIEETYDLSAANLTLIYNVGIDQETLTFTTSSYSIPTLATAEEVVSFINDNATLIEARTSQIGRFIVLNAKVEENENIQVTGGTANAILGFPTSLSETIKLYKDDVKLSKDGITANVDSGNTAPFNLAAIGAFPHTLSVKVDGKTSTQVASVATTDVVNQAAVTVDEIITVLTRDLAGMTATKLNNLSVKITSNTPLSKTSKIQIVSGSLNSVTNGLNFITTEVVGQDKDYLLNRELGIIELTKPLTVNQNVTSGSLFTRAKIRAVVAENYVASNGETIIISVDGGADQTITLDATFVAGLTALATVTFFNLQLKGATAEVRSVGTSNFIEIRTNTFSQAGTIEVKSTSTGNAGFLFPTNTPLTSGQPNKAFIISQNASPYAFAEGSKLTVTVDKDTVSGIFSPTMSFGGVTTGVTSTSILAASALTSTFPLVDEIKDYFVAFTSGGNTTPATVTDVSDQSANIFRYSFSAIPVNFASFAVGDLFSVSGLADASNNGKFVITALGVQNVDVLNTGGVIATLQTGAAVLSLKRQVTAYNQLTGGITVGAAFLVLPVISDPLVLLPSTADNVASYFNNVKVTPISLLAVIEGATNNTKLQISSKKLGSDGFIQIASSGANAQLNFVNTLVKGLQGYNYGTGLVKLVHKTIYGEDSDLVSFPGVGAAGILFRILAPTVKQITINATITLVEGIIASALENELKSKIANYVNALGVGEDFILERVRADVIKVPGVIDVVVNTPNANIAISDNELVRISDSDITIG